MGIFGLFFVYLLSSVGYMESRFLKIKDPDGVRALQHLAASSPASVSKVFMELMLMMDQTNGLHCTHAQLADLCGVSAGTVKNCLSRLREVKYIKFRQSGHGLLIFINSSIVTRCSYEKEVYGDYELWGIRVLTSGASMEWVEDE